MSVPRSIKLGAQVFPLVIPGGMRRMDIVTSYGAAVESPELVNRWAFGVLGMCWAGKPLGWPEAKAVRHSVIDLGELVYDGLDAAGLDPMGAASAVHEVAGAILTSLIPTSAQEQEAKDFTDPPSGA